MEHKIFALGDFALQKGGAVIPDAKLGYVTLGELNDAKDNVVVCPTWFTATPSDTRVLAHRQRAGVEPGAMVHRDPEPLRRGRVLIAEQHAAAI